MAQRQKRKNISEYEQLRQSRAKSLLTQFEHYITDLRQKAVIKAVDYCQKYATRNGEYDQIDDQVCLRDRAKTVQEKINSVLPKMTQHSLNYEQCMAECERNTISYIVANQSCRGVYQKNFMKASVQVSQRLKAEEII